MHCCETKKYQTAVFIIFSLIHSVSFAYDFAGGTGEPNDPYQIETAEQLLQIGSDANLLDKCFILNNDINLDPNITGLPPFTTAPIAPDINIFEDYFQGTSFTGIFDGNNHSILSFVIDSNTEGYRYLGLFGLLDEGSEVKNLGIEDVNITIGYRLRIVGALCGYNYLGTIGNCFSTGAIKGKLNGFIGGLCGYNYKGTISNCVSKVSISCNLAGALGGLCGANEDGIISDCFSTTSVMVGDDSDFIGGLCGYNYRDRMTIPPDEGGVIINCFSTGSVDTGNNSDSIGGLCGRSDYGIISDCFSTSSVNGSNSSTKLGGLCGYIQNQGTILSTINNCYATGSVISYNDSSSLGGLCGSTGGGASISNSFSTGAVTGNSFLGGLCGSVYLGGFYDCFSTGSVTGTDGSSYLGGLFGYAFWGGAVKCYSTGFVTAGQDSEYIGGLCGALSDEWSNVVDCYFLDTSGPDNGFGTPLTDTQMKQQVSFVPWDFIDIWTICEGTNYPRLQWQILPADFLCPDGVDFLDYAFFSNYWLKTECEFLEDCEGADFDLSGCVDGNDLKTFTNSWLEEHLLTPPPFE